MRRLFLLVLMVWLLPVVVASAQTDTESCFGCHDDAGAEADDGRSVAVVSARYLNGVHGDLDCVDCHTQDGDYEDFPHYDSYVPVNCGDCHDDAAEAYRNSIHHLGRRGSPKGGARCVDCHGKAHYVVASDDTASTVYHAKVPRLCAHCHSNETVVTSDYVRLPIGLPTYYASVHGRAWMDGNPKAAVCTDCHNPHGTRIAQDPESQVNHRNIANTCAKCHKDVAEKYGESIHGKATALGVVDSPTCTTCHDEHLMKRDNVAGATTKVGPAQRANQLCGTCHTDEAILAKYGISEGIVESYLDTYHAWAVDRGSAIAATCVDCHNVHEIRSTLDPASSVHDNNVAKTCSRCHERVTQAFATSYTHKSALEARSVHGWVRLIYIGLIAVVLGGMALHNFVVARFELRKHLKKRMQEPYVKRWHRAERLQHIVLLSTFIGLAITGFALRYSEAWWVQLIGLDHSERVRASLHRSFGIILGFAAVYHVIWVMVTRRGRKAIASMVPKLRDVMEAGENVAYHLGKRSQRPAFGEFDYTQKAEYWAVIWGTLVMALTGLVLWFPTEWTSWAPAWIVRVSEVIHWYEAILAVSAIIIWHFFYVIFMPSEYPMSTIWLNGRMPAHEWKEMHRGEYEAAGDGEILHPDEGKTPISVKARPADADDSSPGKRHGRKKDK